LTENVLSDSQLFVIGFLSGIEQRDLSSDLSACTSNNSDILNILKNTMLQLKNIGLNTIPNLMNDLSTLNDLIQSTIINCSNTNEDIILTLDDLNKIKNELSNPNYQAFALKVMSNLMEILQLLNEADDAKSNKDFKTFGYLNGQVFRIILLE